MPSNTHATSPNDKVTSDDLVPAGDFKSFAASNSTVNPIKTARLYCGKTQQLLADQASCSRMAVLRTEQGVFSTPPAAIVTALTVWLRELGERITPTDIEMMYFNWVSLTRQSNGPNVTGRLRYPFKDALESWTRLTSIPLELRGDKHPLVRLRQVSGMSQIKFCTYYCINPGPVHKWESWKQAHMPTQLLYALAEAGYSDSDISYLESLATVEYANHLARLSNSGRDIDV